MPLYINPNDYGFANAAELAKIAGTLQGEAKVGGSLYDRAAIADVIYNRANNPQFRAYNTFTDGNNRFTGAVAQASDPYQFNV